MQQAHSVCKAGRGTNGNDDTVGHRPKSTNSHNVHRRCLRVRWRRLHYISMYLHHAPQHPHQPQPH